ncbi:N-acetyltransferase [Methanosarcina sp. Z-7115]|uniref:N-acetyltransferase n=1 Tax=Methanosarcina baikalica TaxID=3073890 RepID=A0ABU2CX89_9EURY|nr:N-acetyltransferase [Methanosarcina sp. Z-7115]MDR7664298.1 N-acetyltransferase [Methanosarcina sp. Z-7115]
MPLQRKQKLIRKARVDDVVVMKQIINTYSKDELMLARSLSEIYENIRDYYICEIDGEVVGCCSLHVVWEDLAEILALAVNPKCARKGIGAKLVSACLDDARNLGMKEVFALTYVPGFFETLGFKVVDKNSLPRKIWSGCLKCPKFPDCNEIAVLKSINS